MTNEYQAVTTGFARLPEPARYVPIGRRRFRFDIGLSPLGRDHGNRERDALAFQLDDQWSDYRRQKLAALGENRDKYVHVLPGQGPMLAGATRVMAARLAAEHPGLFRLVARDEGGWRLHSRLTGADLVLDPGDPQGISRVFSKLALEVQEDIALMARDDCGQPRLVALHLCFPNHWSPAQKLGGNLQDIHAPLPAGRRLMRNAERLHEILSRGGPWVRFAWGLATDSRLNHHPEPPPGWDAEEWRGRRFDPVDPRLWLRVERQVMLPIPEVSGYAFLIRTYFRAVETLGPEERGRLVTALREMDADTAAYKGLAKDRDAILDWLAVPI